MRETTGVHLFEQCHALLMGLAYRMLASRLDAEDAVQDTFVKWQNANQTEIVASAHHARAHAVHRPS